MHRTDNKLSDGPLHKPHGSSAYRLRAWGSLVIVGGFFFFITATTFASLGVTLSYMIGEFAWSRSQAGLGFSLLGLATGLSGLLPAWTIRRYGITATYILGAATMVCGFSLMYLAAGLLQYYPGAVLLGVGFALCGMAPGVYVINHWLPDRRSLAVGLYMALGGLGAVAGPPLVTGIILYTGSWRMYWSSMAAAMLALLLLAALFIRARAATAQAGSEEPTSGKVYRTRVSWRFRDVMRQPRYYLIVIALTLTLYCTLSMNAWAFTHLGALGASTGLATLALSANGAVNAVARALGGLIATRVDPKWLLVVALLAEATGMLALSVADRPVAIIIFALGEGLGFGLCFLATTLLLLNYFGEQDNPEILGAMNFMSATAMVGPIIAGYIGDRLGGFAVAFQLNAALVLVVALAVSLMRPPGEPVARQTG